MIALPIISALLYLAAAAMLLKRLSRGRDADGKSRPFAIGLGLGAVVLNFPTVMGMFGDHGLYLSFFNILALVTDVVVLTLLFTALRKPVENLGIAILPFAAGTTLLQALMAGHNPMHLVVLNQGMQAHVLLSVLAYSLLTIAAAQAVLLSIQNNHLRKRQPGGFIRTLPPLETMESLLFRIITVGYLLLTLALLSGLFYLDNMFAQHLAHKTILSIAAWITFSLLLWGRWRLGWRGRMAVRWTLAGFASLMLAYFGSKLVLELLITG